ncbi:MAG: UvrD-helicase domain-containing protein [Desulfobacteraceae bacterium]|nr:UvrD-helicase domain-containing protein [Desulfobacteraceae bacterium]
MKQIIDSSERKLALDPERSFIVQAPAGSGKTELLIQRYLGLLSGVAHPEEILAITFTRKAAAEMRNRVLEALFRAADDTTAPEKAHERVTWELARKARQKNVSEGWRIEKYPSRMRIMTIDALCAGLARQMPVLSGFGSPVRIADQPELLYARAARNTVAELEGAGGLSGPVEALVVHLDNRLSAIEELIALMLPKRDQWLRHVVHSGDIRKLRKSLEDAIRGVITRTLLSLRQRFPDDCLLDTVELYRFAAENLESEAPDSLVAKGAGVADLPGTAPEDLAAWQGLAELFLTKDGAWRKAVNKSHGFPPPGSAVGDPGEKAFLEHKKAKFKELVHRLAESPELARALDEARRLPPPEYTETQWEVLESLFSVLKLAAAHLRTVFEQAGRVDFAEIAIRAKSALGEPDDPTDLALTLDYRITHILMDEFQDTSISQFELMRGLTAGWTSGDGRSFFAVGDPMQSIYGFREAEVGLFLKAWEDGLDEHVPLEPIVLRSNFRSDPGIVKWVNRVFSKVLPQSGDVDTGAVPYMSAEPVIDDTGRKGAQVHPLINTDDRQEADLAVECVKQALENYPEETVAVLVRSRPHLKAVVPRLREAGLRFSAVEIDSLKERPMVRDLLSLTRALCHPADRAAWLGILRAPWCGLTLKDLYVIAGADQKSSVYTLIYDQEVVSALSRDGRTRLLRTRQVLDAAVRQRGRRSLRRLVEGAWLSLGGPAAASDSAELADVPVYLDYLEAYAGSEPISDIIGFEQGVFALFAAPDPGADPRLQVMTIHKAKGLEFDTVVIPGLGKAPRTPDPALLLWQELADAPADESLLMAPISEAGAERDPIYNYIYRLRQRKTFYETGRLLYVAATRAKKELHLLGNVAHDPSSGRLRTPDSRSMLGVLWPAVAEVFEKAAEENPFPAGDETVRSGRLAPRLRRLPADFSICSPPADVAAYAETEVKEVSRTFAGGYLPRFDWAGLTLRRVGTVVHRWLRVICEDGLENWDFTGIKEKTGFLREDLCRAGISGADLDAAVSQALQALLNAVSDETGRWILSSRSGGACEYAVSGFLENRLVDAVIDCTFVDRNGIRWVIDYKTGIHAGGGLEEFLDREQQRYSLQMERYARLMEKADPRSVRLGLYFPMIPAWRQWEINRD